jgi:D-alanyl-D-alanine carboxypeptidase/D-alanyl-D-alanine-endopeptidase (penicillin-binding protein 4)
MGAVDRPVHLCVAARPWNDGVMNTTTLHAPAMNPHRRRWWTPPLLAFSAAWVLGGCAHTPAPVQALPAPVRAALERAGLDASTLAVAVLPVDRPARVGDAVGLLHQADRPMQPASAMKVVTSAVALDRVGPNLRGYTELRTAAPIEAGRLRGDLVLRGGADLELGLPQLWALMLELREAHRDRPAAVQPGAIGHRRPSLR